jgi:hypothetical protein
VASGDKANVTQGSEGIVLLDAVGTGATNDGVWVDCGEYTSGTVVALGAATTTVVTVNAHNGVLSSGQLVAPAAAVVGAVVTTGGAGAAVYSSFPVLPRFIKCAVSVTGTGTVSAVLMARK